MNDEKFLLLIWNIFVILYADFCYSSCALTAHAQSMGLILITNNTREFMRVEGLMIEDWTG